MFLLAILTLTPILAAIAFLAWSETRREAISEAHINWVDTYGELLNPQGSKQPRDSKGRFAKRGAKVGV